MKGMCECADGGMCEWEEYANVGNVGNPSSPGLRRINVRMGGVRILTFKSKISPEVK